jgi:Flp pilus assembly protein TadG
MKLRMQFELNEKGQSLIVITLLFFFAFLVFAALGVDGTIIYLRRRQLQNMADAAALAAAEYLSKDKDVATAYQEAMDSIGENGGRVEWYVVPPGATPDPPNTNVGSGVDLTTGIEISNACNVRVALRWNDVGTYFTQFFGRSTLQVGARAHTACNRAGGVTPIAIKRFGDERDWNMDLKKVNDATVYCDECNTQEKMQGPPMQGLGKATEFLRPMSETNDYRDTIEEWPEGLAMYAPPDDFAERDLGAPGREFWILGGGVGPNQGTTSYSGLVNLDIRHVSAPPVEYYNGVGPGTQSNTLKDLAEFYIRRGYCCDIPEPGHQVAMYNGVSASFSPVALQQTYNVGDVIAVIVYNGHVFDTPHLKMTGEDPIHKTTHPTTDTIESNVLTYSIHLEALNGFQSSPSGLCMDVGGPECPDLGVDGLDGFADWSLSPTTRPVLGRNGIDEDWITLTVTPTTTGAGPTAQVITGTRMFYVSDIDGDKPGGTGIRRYWAGIASIGDEVNGIQRDKPAVTCYPTNSEQTYPFVSTVIGQQAKYELKLDLWGVAGTQDVTVSPGALPSGFEWVNTPPWTRGTDPTKHPGSKLQVNLKVNSDVVTNTIHTIPLTVSGAGVEQSCELYVLVEEADSTVKEYVEILGYAAVEIMGYYNSGNPVNPGQSANAVRGRVVSELMSSPPDLTYGLRARLIPWD